MIVSHRPFVIVHSYLQLRFGYFWRGICCRMVCMFMSCLCPLQAVYVLHAMYSLIHCEIVDTFLATVVVLFAL